MKIKISQNRTVERYGTEGTEQENKVVIMEFEFPEEIQDYIKYIEFEIDDNNKVFDLIQNDKYILTSAITKYQEVKAQVVAKKDNDVWKSKMFELKFNKSINADHEIEDEEEIDILNTVIERVEAIEDDIEELKQKGDTYLSNAYLDGTTLVLELNNGQTINVDLSSIAGGGGEGLTPEQIEAINNIEITNEDELIIEYDNTVLNISFSINDRGELIIDNNVSGLNFAINNKDLEAIY